MNFNDTNSAALFGSFSIQDFTNHYKKKTVVMNILRSLSPFLAVAVAIVVGMRFSIVAGVLCVPVIMILTDFVTKRKYKNLCNSLLLSLPNIKALKLPTEDMLSNCHKMVFSNGANVTMENPMLLCYNDFDISLAEFHIKNKKIFGSNLVGLYISMDTDLPLEGSVTVAYDCIGNISLPHQGTGGFLFEKYSVFAQSENDFGNMSRIFDTAEKLYTQLSQAPFMLYIENGRIHFVSNGNGHGKFALTYNKFDLLAKIKKDFAQLTNEAQIAITIQQTNRTF